jgi:telomere length regulation protein
MIVGIAISALIEPLGKSLKFDLEEAESEEAKWFLSLTNVKDTFASLDVFRDPEQTRAKPTKENTLKSLGHPESSKKPSSVPASKIIAIEEITDEEDVEMEDDDLIPYEKPDSDASDSEEDPTLIQRVKPIVPV